MKRRTAHTPLPLSQEWAFVLRWLRPSPPAGEEAVRLLTDAPARLYGLHDRGRIAPGCKADLVLFDPATVGALPEQEREVFSLVRIQGMTQTEAAEVLGVSAKTVQRRLHRGLVLLTGQLADLPPAPAATRRDRFCPTTRLRQRVCHLTP